MPQFLRNILAVFAGIILGSVVNMSLVLVSGHVIPLPEGAVGDTVEGLKQTIHLFEPKHFLFPFLAHALGTLVGAFVAVKLSGNRRCSRKSAVHWHAVCRRGQFHLDGDTVNFRRNDNR